MPKYSHMRDGHLGRILAKRHPIQLSKASATIHSPPYRGRLRQKQLERVKVDKMLKDNVYNAATIERAPTIVFEPKKDGNVRSYVKYQK